MTKVLQYIAKSICAVAILSSFTACGRTSIEGKWVEPVPGMVGQVQGINIERDGKASSINMATLKYDAWEKQGDNLILSGKSIGNHEAISFSDTLSIERLTANELILKKGELIINYTRQ